MPKQYLSLSRKPVLQRSIETLLAVRGMQDVYVAVQPADSAYFKQLDASRDPRVHSVAGADKRVGSVAAAVEAVREQAGDDVWVLVHDAARPLVSLDDIHHLIDTVVMTGTIGGLLATPVQDTLKQVSASGVQRVDTTHAGPQADGRAGKRAGERAGERIGMLATSERTVSRDGLWQAQTPQMFRADALADALAEGMAAMVADSRVVITDEASAFERLGRYPLLVEARQPNLKLTRPADLVLAEALLSLADARIQRP